MYMIEMQQYIYIYIRTDGKTYISIMSIMHYKIISITIVITIRL